MKKKYLLLLLCLPLLVTGCGKVPELQNGQQVVVEVDGKQFTAEEFFDELKANYGTSALVNLVSNYITDQEITEELAKEAEEMAQSEYDTMYAYYGSNWNQVLASSGYSSGEQLLEDITNNYRQSLVLEEYIKTDVITEEEKHFKPTPIISPVYGVLDKNYNKEDITQKKETPITYTSTRISIDEVRKKAYGTLEDDLESTLVDNNSILFNDATKEEDLFDELIDEAKPVKEEPINIIDDDINMIEEAMEPKKDDPITESELFDLIDSMYEKGDQ